MITLFGIPNCDSIKKARKWHKDNGINYEFYDYKKHGVAEKELTIWHLTTGFFTNFTM